MSTSQLCRATNQAIDDLQRARTILATVLEDLEDGMSGLGASKWDTDTGVRASGGSVSDPTGEHALNENSDRERYKRISRHVKTLAAAADGLLTEVASHQARTDTKEDRAAVEKQNDPGCTPCAKAGKWVPPHRNGQGPIGPTDVGGKLDEKQLLCSWHYQFVSAQWRLPNPSEEERHQQGKRVTVRPAGIGEQTSRLIRGIETGSLDEVKETA